MTDRSAAKLPREPQAPDLEPAVKTRVQKVSDAKGAFQEDWIASESPLEVRLSNIPTTVLMRTPGHDEELVRGFLFSEGVISSNDDIGTVSPVHSSPEDVGGSVINVILVPNRQHRTLDRAFYSNTS